ncbi:MAG TPA: restriction endonuclease subunit S [Pyrinomonadaceae bacterium]|nr:restriction endonuclease subunit S [Pyrinomonadaceae bacterium]
MTEKQLPNFWKRTTLGEIARSFSSGGTPSTKNESFWKGSIPWITSKWIDARLYLDSGEKFISYEALRQSATAVVPKGNLIFATRVGVGKVAINNLDLAINQDLTGILLDGENETEFIAYQLRSREIQSKIDSQKRGATIQGITRDNLKSLELTIPPRQEQRKIAFLLRSVHYAIEQQEKMTILTSELRKALIHQLLTRGLRNESQKQAEFGPVPQSWEIAELATAVEQIEYGISAPIPKSQPKNGVKIVSTADITKDGRILYDQIRRIIAPEKTVKRLVLHAGDVLFNWRNSAELIGKSAVFQEQIEPHIFASFILRIRCGEKKSHNYFIAHLMNYFRERGVFFKLARRAVNQANYNRNEISVLNIPLPSYDEQREIADAIAAIDVQLNLHHRKHAALSALFRTLLHQLMTAQVRLNDLDLRELEM